MLRAVITAALVLSVVTPALAAETWDRSFWDPAEAVPGQLELPLPCGARMVFVRVVTPVEPGNPLSDNEIWIGGASDQTGYLDYYRVAHVRGGFTDGERAFYYIGKYEVTRDQWAAVMNETCPEPSRGGARPQGNVTWFDAITFTRQVSEWLRAEAADSLPKEEGVYGYLRLPTEAEWEYAARGGNAVDVADFRGAVPPMETRLEDYAWFQGRTSANGTYRPIGMKRPNPLGLHEMLGSVEEITLEPFRLNNLGRVHGQVGGFVTRGGSIETPAEELRSAQRTEWPFFNALDGRATAFESFGLRPVISEPVNTSLARTTLIRDLWIEEASAEPGAEDDPLAVLDSMLDQQTDKRLREELAIIRSEVVSDRRAREEAAARALRLSLLNGAVVMRWLRQVHVTVGRIEKAIEANENALKMTREGLKTATGDDKADRERSIPRIERNLELARNNLVQTRLNYDLAASAYLTSLTDIDDHHDDDEVRAQASQLIIDLNDRRQQSLAPAVQRFVENIAHRGADPDLSREALLQDVLR